MIEKPKYLTRLEEIKITIRKRENNENKTVLDENEIIFKRGIGWISDRPMHSGEINFINQVAELIRKYNSGEK